MAEYHVTWEIDVEAESPEHAARCAYDAFSRPGSIAHVFDVTHTVTEDCAVPGIERVKMTTTVDIDRGWEPGLDGDPVSYPMTDER